ncbi:MAG TPA: peptidoglycan DD-metalloendopeptidase family protein [Dongiaceae bacterium]|nr:peptidoglycan DD-metalloendopeptidase family protein [Dongiaceae bacterium]
MHKKTKAGKARLAAFWDCLFLAGLGFAALGGIGALNAHRPALTPHAKADEAPRPTAFLPVAPSSAAMISDTLKLNLAAWPASPAAFHPLAPRTPQRDNNQTVAVRSGDTLMSLLRDSGLTQDEAQNAIGALSDLYSPKALKIGQEITVKRDKPGAAVTALKIKSSATQAITLTRTGTGSFVASKVAVPLTSRLSRTTGTIRSSLFGAAREAGLPMPVANELIRTFSYDVDFQREVQPGDSFDVVYERLEDKEGRLAKTGRLLYAALNLSGREIPLYFFDKTDSYYTPSGESVKKSLLRTPVDGARISSGFGMRLHPILGYTKLHKGTDFAAPTGTPIYAAGDGTLEFVGQQRGFGNFILIRHTGQYETAYGHIQRFAAGVKRGMRVKQGQVIAYVGATGEATGPHLHYEVRISGTQVNPQSIKVAAGDRLTGKELKDFQRETAALDRLRTTLAHPGLIAENPR